MSTPLFWAKVGALLMMLAVAVGAFGAHGLKSKVSSDFLAIFETGVRYHVYHALGLFIVSWLSSLAPRGFLTAAGISFLGGIVLFSGSLYLLVLTNTRWLGMITPIGGFSFILGWFFLLLAIWRV